MVGPSAPAYMAAKKGAVIYSTPRPPTPEPPKPVFVAQPESEPVPQSSNLFETRPPSPPQKPKMQWFHDGTSWVYADKQPERKEPESKPEIIYSGASNQNPVAAAVMSNMRTTRNKWGKIEDPNKPKAVPVKCEDCNLTVTCQVTYQTHINGKAHKKRVAQNVILNKEKAKHEAARLAVVAMAVKKAELAAEGKSITKLPELMGQESVKPDPDAAAPATEDFLQKQVNGDFKCTICDTRMNSAACADAHTKGQRHRKNVATHNRRGGFAGRGGLRGGRGGRGGGRAPAPVKVEIKVKEKELNDDARAEYDRVFAEKLAGNTDLESAEEAAINAMNAVLNGSVDLITPAKPTVAIVIPGVTIAPNTNVNNQNQWPPPGITVLKEPKGFKPGEYRCEACEVNLASEPILEAHLNSDDHKLNEARGVSIKKPNSGGVYNPRRGGSKGNTLLAQRGRRGLIAGGEMMPDKLNKSERREQRDIAASIANHLAKQTGEIKVLPLLMSFVRGETIQPDLGTSRKVDKNN